MRRAAAIVSGLAALALARCSVDVEGAPCAAAGTTQDCPSGQACGVDAKCSARATQCVDASLRCAPGAKRCGAQDRVETCAATDPCGAWTVVPGDLDCGASGLTCAAGGGTPYCQCAPGFAGPEFAADPVAGTRVGSAPFPTGASSPPQCRFKSLTEAISAASQVGGSAGVRAHGASGADVVFDGSSGDGAITIPPGVTVLGATGASDTILRGTVAAAGVPLVGLGGALQGFELEASGDGTAVATLPVASCAGVTPSLTSVAIDGGGAATVGVEVSGACGATLTGVDVANVAGPALRVRAEPLAAVTIQAGRLHTSAVGAEIAGGKVTLGASGDTSRSVEITGNAEDGLVLEGGAALDARIYLAQVHGNGGTGIAVESLSPGSALTFAGCDVFSNGRAAPRSYGPAPGRAVGGVLVATAAMPFTFVANRVYGNVGDQLGFESTSAWSIAPNTCGPATNVFACVTPGMYAVAVLAGGTVDARFTFWPGIPYTDFINPAVLVSPPNSYCNGVENAGVPPTPACPAP